MTGLHRSSGHAANVVPRNGAATATARSRPAPEPAPADRTARLSLWARPHRLYLAVAFSVSWALWITTWLIARQIGAGEQVFNADLVDALLFDRSPAGTAIGLSLLSLLGVYGPAIAGVVATHVDPALSLPDLWRRVRRAGIGARWYGLVLGLLALTTGPAILVVALTAERLPGAPGGIELLAFLGAFFGFELLTSGTEEIGWRGYLNERLRHGRDFWETGWTVGIPWAIWHTPVVLFIFAQQGMVPAQMAGSLIGFGIGIVAAAILHAWFYERTGSVLLNILVHAVFNTVPLTMVLLFEGSPAAVISQLALWAVVIQLRRRHERPATGAVQARASSAEHPATGRPSGA